MKVAVVGASGNIGTALLRALRADPSVDEVVGVARRLPPEHPPAPYDAARWVEVDLATPGPDRHVVEPLAAAFAGAAAVVHLAWAMQPSHDRVLQRATNVEGTRRVLAAAVAAGVPHLVVVSSVGAYTPVHDDTPRGEDWTTRGAPTSPYSVDKVAVERMLDRLEHEHPEIAVARIRPALVFQRPAGSSIERYFLGPLAPAAGLRLSRLPVLPWPVGVRVQAVHADDLAALLGAVLADRYAGPLNAAADDVLHREQMAGVLAGGRSVEIPHRLTRFLVDVAWRSRAIAMAPEWVDLAAGVPLLSTERAKDRLGWRPRWSAVDALGDLVRGMAEGAGTASPVLRPRSAAPRSPLGGAVEVR